MSAAPAARAAGRGASLRPARIRSRSIPRPSPHAGRGTNVERSALSASVLQHSLQRQTTRKPSPRASGQKRRTPAIADWFNSTEREQALESLQSLSILPSARQPTTDSAQPFSWRDFDHVVDQLPADHWAHGYIRNVARTLESNASLSGEEKDKILEEVVKTLGDLSRRFEDAEEA